MKLKNFVFYKNLELNLIYISSNKEMHRNNSKKIINFKFLKISIFIYFKVNI